MAPCTMIPIGTIHSPFNGPKGTPIQPSTARGITGHVDVFPEFADGLDDLEGFERIWLLYQLHRSSGFRLKVIPFRDTVLRGLFSTRAPARPNQIGMSAVKLVKRNGTRLTVTDLDIIDGTPLLDIKPYIPEFDAYPDSRFGWMQERSNSTTHADKRFDHTNRRGEP